MSFFRRLNIIDKPTHSVRLIIGLVTVSLFLWLSTVNAQVGSSLNPASRAPFTNCGAAQGIDPADCTALVALYDATGGATWIVSSDWKATDTPCAWAGVTCTSNRVTSLSLVANNLVGTLPNELGNLTGLLDLHLSSNQLTGTIPNVFGTLTSLLALELDNNQLIGDIPVSFGGLVDLIALDLSDNALNGTIPASLGSLGGLQALDLSNNLLNGTIPTELGNLTVLATLDLHFNQLTGGIPASLGDLPALTDLNLESNALVGEVPPNITSLGVMNTLSIGYNLLKSSSAPVITYLDTEAPGWSDTQTITPGVPDLTFNATTFEVVAGWGPITYQDDEGGYEIGCSESSGGPFNTYVTRTIDKSAFDLRFYGLPATTIYCAISSVTLPHDLNQNLLISPQSLAASVVITAAAPPPANDSFDTPLEVDNTPFQYFVNNFNQAQPHSNIPTLPADCAPGFDPTSAKAVHFKIPKIPVNFDGSRGGPGYFATGAGTVSAGGPGYFATRGLNSSGRDAAADTVIAVYKRNIDGTFTVVACNDDDLEDVSASGGAELVFNREAYALYRVVVWVKDSAEQQLVIRMATRSGIVNGGFKYDSNRDKLPDFWKVTNVLQIKRKCVAEKAFKPPCYVQMKGTGIRTEISQSVFGVSNFNTGDKLHLRGQIWRKNLQVGGYIQLKVKYVDSGLGNAKATFDMPIGTGDYDLMKIQGLVLEGAVKKAIIQIGYSGIGGTLRIDEVRFKHQKAVTGASADVIDLPASPLPLPADHSSQAARSTQ